MLKLDLHSSTSPCRESNAGPNDKINLTHFWESIIFLEPYLLRQLFSNTIMSISTAKSSVKLAITNSELNVFLDVPKNFRETCNEDEWDKEFLLQSFLLIKQCLFESKLWIFQLNLWIEKPSDANCHLPAILLRDCLSPAIGTAKNKIKIKIFTSFSSFRSLLLNSWNWSNILHEPGPGYAK